MMDKNDAIRISKKYIEKVRQNGIPVLGSWLFGSYAKGTYHKDSDIDLAILLPGNLMSFDETHTYSPDDFLMNTPLVAQIKQDGLPV
jgi:predicted nucleotidyltransferase